MHKQLPLTFAGQDFILHHSGALYWPAEKLLIVSDLHLEKGSFFAKFGSLLPRYDTRHTLQKLSAVMAEYMPESVLCLGDSFHDRSAHDRLLQDDLDQLHSLMLSAQAWHWIIGNHDTEFPETISGQRHIFMTRQGITLRHEPEQGEILPQIIGHFHPKLKMSLGGHKVRGPAFIQASNMLIMPAFGSFTGGLDVYDPAFEPLVNKPSYFLLFRDKIWPVQGEQT